LIFLDVINSNVFIANSTNRYFTGSDIYYVIVFYVISVFNWYSVSYENF